jgi:hypothetical protein
LEEVLSSLCQVSRTHHVISVLELTALGHHSLLSRFLSSLLHHVEGVLVVLIIDSVRHHVVVPINLELSDSWLLHENVPDQLCNIRFHGRVLIHLWVFIVVVHIVAHSEELLVVVGACQQKCSDPYDVYLGKSSSIWS